MTNNRQNLIKYLEKNTNLSNIGLIITDIEMPVLDGFQVISIIKKSNEFKNIVLKNHRNYRII